jgi:hypothetical protein
MGSSTGGNPKSITVISTQRESYKREGTGPVAGIGEDRVGGQVKGLQRGNGAFGVAGGYQEFEMLTLHHTLRADGIDRRRLVSGLEYEYIYLLGIGENAVGGDKCQNILPCLGVIGRERK